MNPSSFYIAPVSIDSGKIVPVYAGVVVRGNIPANGEVAALVKAGRITYFQPVCYDSRELAEGRLESLMEWFLAEFGETPETEMGVRFEIHKGTPTVLFPDALPDLPYTND